ncbi:Hypothetical protein FKW44_012960, partial [Caligus rogercresseyi]
QFRSGLGLSTRISGVDERRATEEAARLEEEEEFEVERISSPSEQLPNTTQAIRIQESEEADCNDVSSKDNCMLPIELNKNDVSSNDECMLPIEVNKLMLRDDWTKVMSRGSSIPMKKTSVPKKSKRGLTSPENENSKRTNEWNGNSSHPKTK